ncbi:MULTISPECIES: protein-glutamate O-methyltransferase CheR [Exiguobacterium]|uniref:CheR family methyltransferase n=1 Tax=Exiguobacterium TaxID=33986 RepID=UPI0004787897|nr:MULTISPECIES: protein-glutamate O-methyltransferase CheR [Exiguobacterium]
MNDYAIFVKKFYIKSGIDLNLYKEAQMKRRMVALREKKGYASFLEYLKAMDMDRQLYEEFLDRMTINVSEFYRNPIRWQQLEEDILPYLIRSSKGKLRVWSAACSTGEEPYSLAMLLSKHLAPSQFSIMATDLDDVVIEKAKQGKYHERALIDLPVEFQKRYFTRRGEDYFISDEIKQLVTFKKHNLLADVYERNFDLIVCRNVLIYFTEDAKGKVYSSFQRALRPGGMLFVGGTEQIFQPKRYGYAMKQSFFYEKIDG